MEGAQSHIVLMIAIVITYETYTTTVHVNTFTIIFFYPYWNNIHLILSVY